MKKAHRAGLEEKHVMEIRFKTLKYLFFNLVYYHIKHECDRNFLLRIMNRMIISDGQNVILGIRIVAL
jgi:hypothetical protein